MDKSLIEKYRKEMLEKYGGTAPAEAAPAAAMNVNPTDTDEKTASSEKGRLSAWVTSVANIYPVKNARVTVFTGSPDNMTVVDSCATDESGKTKEFLLDAPPKSLSMASGAPALPYTLYNLRVSADGFLDNIHLNIPVFSGITSVQKSDMLPNAVAGGRTDPVIFNEFSSFEL